LTAFSAANPAISTFQYSTRLKTSIETAITLQHTILKNARNRLAIFKECLGLSRTYTKFQHFPGLENMILKLKDFPRFSRICTNPDATIIQ